MAFHGFNSKKLCQCFVYSWDLHEYTRCLVMTQDQYASVTGTTSTPASTAQRRHSEQPALCGILRERSPTLFLSAEPPWEMPPCFLSKIKPFVPFSAGSCVAGGEAMQCDTEDKCKCMIVTPEGSIIRIGGKQPKPETDPDWEDRQALSARQSVSAAASSELCVHSRSSCSVECALCAPPSKHTPIGCSD